MITKEFIESVERCHFRTREDTGANPNAMFIWNLVREEAGLPILTSRDLAAWCPTCEQYHVKPNSEKCLES